MPVAAIAGPVLGAVAGGLLSRNKGSSGSSTVTQTQSNAPWEGQAPYLSDVYGRAQGLANNGAYPGPYIAPQSQYTRQGVNSLVAGADDPNSPVNTAARTLQGTLRGDYLNVENNPYLRGAVEQALGLAGAGVSSRFSGEGYGGSGNQEWLGRILSNTALPIYSQAYQTERQNQLNAIPLAQGVQMAQSQPYLMAGGIEDARGAAEVAAGKEQFYAPWDVLSRYSNIIGGATYGGGTGSTTTPYYTNPLANTLGGAIGGAQIGQQVGGWFGQAPQSYNDFMSNAYANGFGPAFTQPGVYG